MYINVVYMIESITQYIIGVDEINSTHYHLVAGDLRDTEQLDRKLLAAGVDKK